MEKKKIKNRLISIAKEELGRKDFVPVRSAKIRVVAEANSEFRENVEYLLEMINNERMSPILALKWMVFINASIKNKQMEALRLIEEETYHPQKGNFEERSKYLIDNYGTDDWFELNKIVFKNVLSGRSSDSMSTDETKEKTESEHDKNVKLEKLLADLDQLIGLAKVKETIHRHVDWIKYYRILEKKGEQPSPISLHMVFSGNPGTGKTMVANLVAQIYKELGLLPMGHLVTAKREDLVGTYIGDTEEKTKKKIKEAHGGVLFIDEAYALAPEGKDDQRDFGNRAIEVLLTAMEEYRDEFVVIAAGYSDEMDRFLNSNPGLPSRFSTILAFDDYSGEELYAICKMMLEKEHLIMDDKIAKMLNSFCNYLYNNKRLNFGNARDIRTFVEKLRMRMASRLVNKGNIEELKQEELLTLLEEDVLWTISQDYPGFIGVMNKEGDVKNG